MMSRREDIGDLADSIESAAAEIGRKIMDFEQRYQKLIDENRALEKENAELKERIGDLEGELESVSSGMAGMGEG